jgi:hypothetical protein
MIRVGQRVTSWAILPWIGCSLAVLLLLLAGWGESRKCPNFPCPLTTSWAGTVSAWGTESQPGIKVPRHIAVMPAMNSDILDDEESEEEFPTGSVDGGSVKLAAPTLPSHYMQRLANCRYDPGPSPHSPTLRC